MRRPHVTPEAIADVFMPRLDLAGGLAHVSMQEVWLGGQRAQPKDALYVQTPPIQTDGMNTPNVATDIAQRSRIRTGGRQSSAGRRFQ